jgi:NadR type nicotinamide-nucleotide adenylyltransferase
MIHMIRIVFIGSESTGKSTLAAAVAKHYGVEVVPEFVRAFAEQRGGVIEFSDHGPIARGQMALEDEYVARAMRIVPAPPAPPALVVQDTDLLSTVVYCKHYFGRCPEWIEEAARGRRPDLYLLCDIDVPWIADGVRDRGHMRDEMQELFTAAVAASQAANASISGAPDVRLARAIDIIDQLMKSRS